MYEIIDARKSVRSIHIKEIKDGMFFEKCGYVYVMLCSNDGTVYNYSEGRTENFFLEETAIPLDVEIRVLGDLKI